MAVEDILEDGGEVDESPENVGVEMLGLRPRIPFENDPDGGKE